MIYVWNVLNHPLMIKTMVFSETVFVARFSQSLVGYTFFGEIVLGLRPIYTCELWNLRETMGMKWEIFEVGNACKGEEAFGLFFLERYALYR